MKSIELTGEIIKTNTPFAIPLDTALVNIKPMQDLHGYDSPWPAGGGKNLYDANAINTLSSNGITATVNNGAITFNGTATATAYFNVDSIQPASGQYAFSFNNPVASSDVHVSFRSTSGLYFSDTGASEVNKSVAISGEPSTVILYIRSGTTLTNFVIRPQLEFGSTPTAWAPYSNLCPINGWTGANVIVSPTTDAQDGATYPISWQSEAGTVYGGTLDVTTGLLTVDRKFITLNGTENFIARSVSGSFYCVVPDALQLNATSQLSVNGILSSYYKSASWGSGQSDDKYVSCFYYGGIHIKDTSYSSVEQLKTALSNNPLQVVYPLNATQTYQLTPTQIALMAGENNVWADCGNIAIAYRPFHRFAFDGVNSIDNGVYVFPTDSMVAAPARQYIEQVVPGRSGVLLMDNGRYDNILHEYQFVTDDDGETNIALLRNILASRVGYCRLTDTFDPDHYYMAVYKQNFTPVLEWRKKDMAKAKISFYRKPQRFLLTGENVITLISSGNITNPTQFKSKPLLKVTTNRATASVLGVGSTNITIKRQGVTYIDCEMGRAYNGATPLDTFISLNTIDFPTLEPGSNGISLGTGISRVEITPRWWEI